MDLLTCERFARHVVAAYVTLTLVVSVGSVVHSYSPGGAEMSTRCILDDDGTSPEVDTCLRSADLFLERYLRHIRENTLTDFDRCSESAAFRRCFGPLVTSCLSVRQAQVHWHVIYDVMNNACNNSLADQRSVLCFEDQYGGVLSKRCDARYRFNLRQRTRHKCDFVRENVECKESLVSSACGENTGKLAFHILRLDAVRDMNKKPCIITRKSNYENSVFKYDERCPADLAERLDECRGSYLEDSQLTFHDDNDLIADGRRRDIRRACKDFKEYKRCVRPIKKQCSSGTKLVYDYDGRLRTYILKMEYICNGIKLDYSEHLPCYRDILRNGTLGLCDDIWQMLHPMLNNVSAYQFYCQPDTPDSTLLQKMLDKLRVCYEDVFTDNCGLEGGSVIGGLMMRAFRDPFYLRYRYKPNCSLHRKPESHVPTTAPPDAKPTVKTRSFPLFTSGARAAGRVQNRNSQLVLLFTVILHLTLQFYTLGTNS